MHYLRMSASSTTEHDSSTTGYTKLRLAHGIQGTIVVIDALFALRRPSGTLWDYYLPSFFSAPQIIFNDDDDDADLGSHILLVSVDIAKPSGKDAIRITLRIRSAGLIHQYDDGAQLYQCNIAHSWALSDYRSGRARQVGSLFYIEIFHHTANATKPKILSSGHLRGSPWNLQGTRQLINVCYPYFTTLRRIRNETDLARIAMAGGGRILLRGTGAHTADDPMAELHVYRETTQNRTATLALWVPAGIVAPNHLRLHKPPGIQVAYYEVVLPEVVRVGLAPGFVLPIYGGSVHPEKASFKTFDYIVCGDAATEAGLIAPFDEENTAEVLHLERLLKSDLFTFWQENANSDQVTGRNPEYRLLQP